jgi:hypothetical protein
MLHQLSNLVDAAIAPSTALGNPIIILEVSNSEYNYCKNRCVAVDRSQCYNFILRDHCRSK